jgi:hypothetical protein
VDVRGEEDFARLAAALKNAANKDLRRELNKGLNSAAKPFIQAVRAEARQRLPRRGGLNETVAKSRISVRKSAKTGIRVQAGGRRSQLDRVNAGRVRHPVFNTGVWIDQAVTPGFWDDPAQDLGPTVVKEGRDAVGRVLAEIDRRT